MREVRGARCEVCAPLSSPPGARVHVLCAALLCAPRLGRSGAEVGQRSAEERALPLRDAGNVGSLTESLQHAIQSRFPSRPRWACGAAARHCTCPSRRISKAWCGKAAGHCRATRPEQCRGARRSSWPGCAPSTPSAACANFGPGSARGYLMTSLPARPCAPSALRCEGWVAENVTRPCWSRPCARTSKAATPTCRQQQAQQLLPRRRRRSSRQVRSLRAQRGLAHIQKSLLFV